MNVSRTDRFKRAWKKLSGEDKSLAQKAIINLATDIRYPSLRVKKIKGAEGIWEARASLSLRITFEIGSDTIILRNVGQHDETLRQP